MRMEMRRISVWLLFFGLIGIAGEPAAAEVVAWYRFEGTHGTTAGAVTDSSGHGLDGVGVGSPTYSSSVGMNLLPPGTIVNTASMLFDGSSQRVFIPDYDALKLTHSMTLEAWINTNADPLERGDIIFRGDDHGGYDPYHLSVTNGGTRVAFMITDATNASMTVSAPVPMHQWVHVAGTLDDTTGLIKLYVNGALADINTTTIRPFADLDPTGAPGLGIGGLQSDNPFLNKTYFNGLIDEVRISDMALSPSEFLAPEPSSLAVIGIACIGWLQRRRRVGREVAA
jgi:hypothetical protein